MQEEKAAGLTLRELRGEAQDRHLNGQWAGSSLPPERRLSDDVPKASSKQPMDPRFPHLPMQLWPNQGV